MAEIGMTALKGLIGDALKDTLGSDILKSLIDQRIEETQGFRQPTHGKEGFSPVQMAQVNSLLEPLMAGRVGSESLDSNTRYSQMVQALSDTLMSQSLTRGNRIQNAHTLYHSTKGFRFARVTRLFAMTKDLRTAYELYEKHYGKDEMITRAMAATDAAAGGSLIAEELSADIIEFLRARSVVRGMSPTMDTMTRGQMVYTTLGGTTGGYVGENRNAPHTEMSTGEVRAVAKKLAALVAVSNDLIRRTDGQADRLVRDDVIEALRERSDQAFIRDNGSSAAPRGLRHWAPAANVIAANATVNLANVTVDLGKLLLALYNGKTRMIRPGWLMSPRSYVYLMTVRDGNGNFAFRDEMMTGRLLMYPFDFTTNIPINLGGGANESELYLADFADVVIPEVPMLEVTGWDGGSYYDGSAVISGISQDQTVIRALQEHDLVMRHAGSVAVLTAVLWA